MRGRVGRPNALAPSSLVRSMAASRAASTKLLLCDPECTPYARSSAVLTVRGVYGMYTSGSIQDACPFLLVAVFDTDTSSSSSALSSSTPPSSSSEKAASLACSFSSAGSLSPDRGATSTSSWLVSAAPSSSFSPLVLRGPTHARMFRMTSAASVCEDVPFRPISKMVSCGLNPLILLSIDARAASISAASSSKIGCSCDQPLDATMSRDRRALWTDAEFRVFM
ncbi:hypothetical protein VTK73DRAFT_6751 [Phialemonium thermophilum]|uniref:Uncharacterized protein n=1 Tax=Phialemonium thermophilum TaxID=223376 RepID=A0ABR3WIF0_9PEZI